MLENNTWYVGIINRIISKTSEKSGEYICLEIMLKDGSLYYKNYFVNHPNTDYANNAKQALKWLTLDKSTDSITGLDVAVMVDTNSPFKTCTKVKAIRPF